MLNQNFVTQIIKCSIFGLLTLAALMLAGCSGKSDSGSGTFTPSRNAPAVQKVVQPVTIHLVDENGYSVDSVSFTTPTYVLVQLKDSNDQPVAKTIVGIDGDANLLAVNPSSATTLTNANGVASFVLSPANANASGVTTIKVSAVVDGKVVSSPDTPVYVVPSSQPLMSMALLDSSNKVVSSITNSSPVKAAVLLRDPYGNPVPNTIVLFESDPNVVTLSPSSTALTGSDGVAYVMVQPANIGVSTASLIIASSGGLSASVNFAVGNADVKLSSLQFGKTPLNAYDSTDISVTVLSNNTAVTSPQTVTFSSPCANSGKAILTASSTTINGVAKATYRDKGCASTDIITASLSSLTANTGSLVVNPPSTGSIQFVSSTPNSISLKGMGGAGRQEYSTVEFKVVDTNGSPVAGKTVNFKLSTSLGGISLTNSSAVSDENGKVLTTINAGTQNTPVQVTASTTVGTNTLSTQSDMLTITTGVPEQPSFSISATTHNLEGWNIDGITSTVNIRAADHFGNPVQDGTVVNFRAEGGQIEPYCILAKGACSVTFTSANSRPDNGRVTVLAYAIGSEGFTDLNGDGYANKTNEMIDANGIDTDMPEAFLDYNENNKYDATSEPFIDFNSDGIYNKTGDKEYNGVLCNPLASNGTTCSAQKSIHVRESHVLVLSSGRAVITFSKVNPDNSTTPIDAINLAPCTATGLGAPSNYVATVLDIHDNLPPAGSKVELLAGNGKVLSESTIIIPNSTGCRTGIFCPSGTGTATFGDLKFSMQTDATYTPASTSGTTVTPASCNNPNAVGNLTVRVTTPSGKTTSASISVAD